MIEVVQREIERRLRGIRQAFRGVVRLVNAAGAVQLVQGDALAGETLQAAELFQHYGYTSNPPAGTMYVVLPLGGKTVHSIIVATEHGAYRLKNLAPGETAIYDDQGQKVHITRAGIVIDGAGKPVSIVNTPSVTADTPQFNMTGNLAVAGDIVAQGDISDHGDKSMLGMRQVYNGHTHPENDSGGPTAQPNQAM